MGQLPRKHGAHGAPPWTTWARGDRGAVSLGSVGPKSVTVGTDRAAARCATPVSPLTRQERRLSSGGRSAGRSRPTSERGEDRDAERTSAAPGPSAAEPRSKGASPAPASASASIAKECALHRFAGPAAAPRWSPTSRAPGGAPAPRKRPPTPPPPPG